MRVLAVLIAFLSFLAAVYVRAEPAATMTSTVTATESKLKSDPADGGLATSVADLERMNARDDDSPVEFVEVFVEANSLYEQGTYDQAIEHYQAIVDGGAAGGQVYFNLGNSYLRNGELGKAVASYLRSRRLLPREEDVQANLGFARSSSKDAIDPPDPAPLLEALFFWHYGLSREEVLRLFVALNWLFWSTCVARLFWGRSETLRWTFMVLLILLLAIGGSAAASLLAPGSVAVVIPQEIDAHTGPSGDSVIRFKLHAGTELRIEAARDGWLRVVLPTGEQGWIDRSWAEVVTDNG